MLFRRSARKRLEPVRVMGCAALHGPFFHGLRHGIRNVNIQRLAIVDGFAQRLVHIGRKRLLHGALVINHGAVNFSNFIHGETPFSCADASQQDASGTLGVARQIARTQVTFLFYMKQTMPHTRFMSKSAGNGEPATHENEIDERKVRRCALCCWKKGSEFEVVVGWK